MDRQGVSSSDTYRVARLKAVECRKPKNIQVIVSFSVAAGRLSRRKSGFCVGGAPTQTYSVTIYAVRLHPLRKPCRFRA